MKRLFVLIGCIFALAGAAGATTLEVGGPGDRGIYTTHLSNGLHVVVVEDRAAPVVQTEVWYRFGSLDETPGKTGLAHALEHMMFRGSDHISAGGLDDIVARLGAEMNAETSYDATHFYFVMPSDKLNVGLAIEADRMRFLQLRQSEWSIERGAVLNEIEGDESSPFFTLLERVRAAAYPQQPNGRTPLGSRSDVAGARASDIAAYYRRWYAPNNATLVVAGDVDHDAVFAEVQRQFGAIPPKKLPSRPARHPIAAHGAVVESNVPFPFEVLDLAYAVPGDSEPGEPEISTLATLITNQRSPFYQALVESNIALAIEANADTQLKGGLLHIFVVLNPGHTASEAQAVFQSTLDAQLQSGFSPDLVTAARRLTIADRLYSADSITGIGDLAGYTYGIVGEKISDEDGRLAALTPADLLDAAKRYLATPTVVGHLRSSNSQTQGASQKSDASASDDFSKRVPNGPIVEPASVRSAVRTPTTARSKLDPVEFTLGNGIRVIVQEKHDRPTFVLRGTIDASPAFEPESKSGLIRLASSVADYGSEHYPFAQRRKSIDELGAYVSSGQSFEARGLARDFSTIVGIVADGEERPTFAEPWFTIERDQLANSLQSEDTISGTLIDRAYLRLLASPGDPSLHHATSATVGSLTRDDLLAFAKTYWRPDLTTIAVVGDISASEVRNQLSSAFGSWTVAGAKPDPHDEPYPAAHAGHAYVGTGASQVYIRLGQPAVSRGNPDYDTFLVLNQILGASGSFESRLWQELRQKRGLVYSIGSSVSSNNDRGNFRVEFNATPARVVEAVRFVRSELERLRTEPVTATELEEAKLRLVSNALLEEASADGQVSQILDIATNGLPADYYRSLNERFAKISAADVQRVAKEYLVPDALVQIYAGPPGVWAERSL
ncbi:MAG: pitrilysin family protein [Candidatus Baltobacteraceae bacterium]